MGKMKIEKMCSKQDIVSTLKKSATYSNLEHLRKLAEYIQQELELENLKENIIIEHYEIKYSKGQYQLVKMKSQFDSEKNKWNCIKTEIVESIDIDVIENIC